MVLATADFMPSQDSVLARTGNDIDIEDDELRLDGDGETENSDLEAMTKMDESLPTWDTDHQHHHHLHHHQSAEMGRMVAPRHGEMDDPHHDHQHQYHPMMEFPDLAKQKVMAPELRRTFSMPTPAHAREESAMELPTTTAAAAAKALNRAGNRPQALELKSTQEEAHRFQIPLGPPTASDPEYKALTIGDHAEVTAFLETRFRQLQQLVCKIVAKAWIKVIEPKKQTRYPYNKGEESKPVWWPPEVRHKEPDHLMKPERINLLMTMLRCGKVPTNRLELATAEVAAFIPPDKINLLREIYRVGREEERFRCREIAGDTEIFVAATASASTLGLDDLNSPSTAGMRGSVGPSDGTPRSASTMYEAGMALQRSTSHHHHHQSQTPHFDERDPFTEGVDVPPHAYAMMPPQNFYYPGPETSFGGEPNAAIMNAAASQALSAQQFQEVQQQQMFVAQQAQARRQGPTAAARAQDPFQQQPAWPHNLDQGWAQSPSAAAAVFQQQAPIQRPDHQQEGPDVTSDFYGQAPALETPARRTHMSRQQEQQQGNLRSSPYLPTPLRPEGQFSASRNNQGVSFSDYLHSPRTGGPGPVHEEGGGDYR